MSDYLKGLRKQAEDGVELAGDDFAAEINIDCRNIIKLLDQIEVEQATIQKLCNGLDQITSYAYSRASDKDREIIKEYHKLAQQYGEEGK